MEVPSALHDSKEGQEDSASRQSFENSFMLSNEEQFRTVRKPQVLRESDGERAVGEMHVDTKKSTSIANERGHKQRNIQEKKDVENPMGLHLDHTSFPHASNTAMDSRGTPSYPIRFSTVTTVPARFQGSTGLKKAARRYVVGSDTTSPSTVGVGNKTWGRSCGSAARSSSGNGGRSGGMSVVNDARGKMGRLSTGGKLQSGSTSSTLSFDPFVHPNESAFASSNGETLVGVTGQALVQGSKGGKYIGTCLVAITVTPSTRCSWDSPHASPPYLVIEDSKGVLLCKMSLTHTILSQDSHRPLYVYVERQENSAERHYSGELFEPVGEKKKFMENSPQNSLSVVEGQWSFMFQGQEAVAHFFVSAAIALASFYDLISPSSTVLNAPRRIQTLYHSPIPIKVCRGSASSNISGTDVCGDAAGKFSGCSAKDSITGTCALSPATTTVGIGKDGIRVQRGDEVHLSYSLWKVENAFSTTLAVKLGNLVGDVPREAGKKVVVGASNQQEIEHALEEAMIGMTPGDVKIICFLPTSPVPPTSPSHHHLSCTSSSSSCSSYEVAPCVAWISCVSITSSPSTLPVSGPVMMNKDKVRDNCSNAAEVAKPEGPVLAPSSGLPDVAFHASSSMNASVLSLNQKPLSQFVEGFVTLPSAECTLSALQRQISALQLTVAELSQTKAISLPSTSLPDASPGILSAPMIGDFNEEKSSQKRLDLPTAHAHQRLGMMSKISAHHDKIGIHGSTAHIPETSERFEVFGDVSKTPIRNLDSSFASVASANHYESTPTTSNAWTLKERDIRRFCKDVYKEIKFQLLSPDSQHDRGDEMLSKVETKHVLRVVANCIKRKEKEFIAGRRIQTPGTEAALTSMVGTSPDVVFPRGSSEAARFSITQALPYHGTHRSSSFDPSVGDEVSLCCASLSTLQRGDCPEFLKQRPVNLWGGLTPPTHRFPSGSGVPPLSPLCSSGTAALSIESGKPYVLAEQCFSKGGDKSERELVCRHPGGRQEESWRSSSGAPPSSFRSLGQALSNGNSQFFNSSRGGGSSLMSRSGVNSMREEDDTSILGRSCSFASSTFCTPAPRRAILLGSNDFRGCPTPSVASENHE